MEGVERLIPLRVTDLAPSVPAIFALPLDLTSLYTLTQVFARIEAQVERECSDGRNPGSQPIRADDSSPPSLADADNHPAPNSAAHNGADLPVSQHAIQRGGDE